MNPRATLHTIAAGGVSLSVATAGPTSGTPVLLLHGFPELAYSWRHQIEALSQAGCFVMAPDQRGYGASDCPPEISDYRITELVADAVAVIRHFGHDRAVVFGHDWGSLVAQSMALMTPERVVGCGLMSVPFLPLGDQSPIDRLTAQPNESFQYMLDFQNPGVEELFDADPIAMLKTVYASAAAGDHDEPQHLSDGDFEAYARAFMRTGFGPGINWYRNLHANWELMRAWRHVGPSVPLAFCGGSEDFVTTEAGPALADGDTSMEAMCADFRGATVIDGAGHWMQQEKPEQVNAWMLDFIASVAPATS